MIDIADYSAEIPLPTVDDTRSLAQLIKDLYEAELAVEVAEAELKAKKQRVSDLELTAIPEMMAHMHMEKFSNGGLSVEVKKDVWASISAERAADAHRWLVENGHGGLIKREIAVPFAMGQEQLASDLRRELDSKFPGSVKQEEWVEPMSLKAFIRKQLEAGKVIPMELFAAQEYRKAKVKSAK